MKVPLRVDGLFQTELTPKQKKNSELNIEEYNRNNVELHSYPRRVLLELTNMCNYRCIMCGRNATSFRPSFLDLNFIERFSHVFEYAEEVTLFGWGEPTIHPEFSNIMKFASKFPQLRKYLLTNGSNLDFIKKIVKMGVLDILAISLDGATPKMNNLIRCGSDFDYITNKIEEIVLLGEEGYKVPFINLVFVIMMRNVYQLPDMIKLTKRLGLPELKAVYLTSFGGVLENETMWMNPEIYRPIRDSALELADKLGVLVKLPPVIGEDQTADFPHKKCSVAWRDMFVSSDCSVRPCQSSPVKLGTLIGDSLKSADAFFRFWNSSDYKIFRKTVNNFDEMNTNCRYCYQSSHANWNLKHAHIQPCFGSIPQWGMRL